MKRTTLGRVGLSAAVVLSLTASACGASNGSSPAGTASGAGPAASTGPSSAATASAGGAPSASNGPSSAATASAGGAPSAPAAGQPLSGSVSGAGSSAQTAAMQAWVAGFQSSNPNVTVNYDSVGSGSGVSQFTSGGVDFAGSDKALTTAELATGKTRCKSAALDIPTYVSPIAIVYNLPGVKDLQLAPKTSAGIFAGKITTWNDPAIKADNPNANLPSTKITPVHRSDKSGTTNNFTDYLSKTAPSQWTGGATEVWPVSGGEAAKGTSGVVAAIKQGNGAIGYADDSQAGGLSKAKVKVGNTYVAPSANGAAATLADSKPVSGRPNGDLSIAINRTTAAAGAYPVLLVSYEIFCTTYSDAAKGGLVKGLLTYIVSSAGQQAAAKSAGSAPLPSSLATQAKASVDMIGSAG